jgi:hypothetical protein
VVFLLFQLQQDASAKRRTGTETPAPASDSRERENGQMAVHATVRRVDHGDKETTHGGKEENKKEWSNFICYLFP